MDDEEVLVNVSCLDLYVPQPNQTLKTSLIADCRELLQRLKNLIFEVEESFSELN